MGTWKLVESIAETQLAMKMVLRHLLGALLVGKYVLAAPQHHGDAEPDPSTFVNVTFQGHTFVNKGLVGFGLIPSNFKESTGDTFGGIGSAIAMQRRTWKKQKDGTYTGTLTVQPDRGFNVDNTIDYQARQHQITVTLTPYYGTTNLSFNDSQRTLQLKYRATLLYSDSDGRHSSGLDPLAVRPSERVRGVLEPPEPIANHTYNHISIDAEGLVINEDGSFWVSEEYGPMIHRFSPKGSLIQSISPPRALLPFYASANSTTSTLNFTTSVDPTTGRTGNQGFEGLSASPSGDKLFACLQSAAIQDGGDQKSTSHNTRLLEYDVSHPSGTPRLTGEWVVPLPVTASKGNTLAQSEIHYLTDKTFLILARDADGNGGSDASSAYKSIDLIDISKATNIADSKFDDPAHPIAVNGTLDPSIKPAVYQQFVSLIDDAQLAKFGMHNGKPIDRTLVNSKWESIALAPVDDPKYPNDYFIFTASDNDFLTTQGVAIGQHYNASQDVDNQLMVFRVTLPNVSKGSVERSIGI